MSAKPWFTISNAAAGKPVDVLIYDVIDSYGGVGANDFVRALAALGGRDINVRINSPGGSVTEGVAIYNALRAHSGKVAGQIDGIAASMASYVAMACAPLSMADNARIMIHNPSGGCMGDAEDMRQTADILDGFTTTLANGYAVRSGKTVDEIKAAMDKETWFTADEAKAFGLIDTVTGASSAKASFDLSQFKNVPADVTAETEPTMLNTKTLAEVTAELETATGTITAHAATIATHADDIAGKDMEIADSKALLKTATDELATVKAKLATAEPHKATADAQALEIATLKATITDYETKPTSKAYQLAAQICARAGVDALKLGAKGEKQNVVMSYDEFSALSPQAKAEHFKNGGTISGAGKSTK